MRTDFLKGKKGQPQFDAAKIAYLKEKAKHEAKKAEIKQAEVSKPKRTHRFSCNVNYLEGIPTEAVKQVCEKAGLEYTNQGLGGLGLQLGEGEKKPKREPISKTTKLLLLEEQQHSCASCEAAITLATSHTDHIIPQASGGTNDKENLQQLCIACHHEKSAREKEEGYGQAFPDYHSQFAPSVYEHFVKHVHPLPFVEYVPVPKPKNPIQKAFGLPGDYFTPEELQSMATWQIDYNGQYPNILRYRENVWPKFSVMDRPDSGRTTVDSTAEA